MWWIRYKNIFIELTVTSMLQIQTKSAQVKRFELTVHIAPSALNIKECDNVLI